ncbi:hypothetical protein B0H13DRAFT_1875476 [Mycena leptocephala]|nr:hypothetical protein B0H13DRAFT_1906100 [Mycena leptocephala]KAJ7911870.1 hypothetical protein B0H13DRAFT_1875476 [Mycena leptocephala]
MPAAEIVKALGPGTLHQFSSSYQTATESFTNLLLYPFLQSIVLSNPNNIKSNEQDLRTLVVDGSSRFGQLCTTNISIAQQVNSYGKVVPVLLKGETISKYTTYAKPLIEKYVAEAEASGNENKQFFMEFQAYISTVDQKIALIAPKVAGLTTDIENANIELGNANVGAVIGDLIKTFFKIGSGEDGNVQIATLLGVGIDTLKSSFTQLWANQQHLKGLIKGLTNLKDTLTTVETLFSKLRGALTGVLSDAKALLSIWSDVQTRLGTVESVDRMVTDAELTQIVVEWTKAQEAATAYVGAVSGSGATRAVPTRQLINEATAAVAHHMPKVPRTQGELKMAHLITSLDLTDAGGKPKVTDSDREKLLKLAGRVRLFLDELILQTSGVMEEFNALLRIPYLNQLQCNNPDKPSEKIDIQTMVTNYQKMYWDLQQETVPLAQELQAYSNAVLLLLPKLVSTPTGKPGEVTATEISNKSVMFKNKWNNAKLAVEQAIEECKASIEMRLGESINELTAEVKRQTLMAVFGAIGALACFAAAAFLPGGFLVTGGLVFGGTALLGMTIAAIVEIGKVCPPAAAIDELKRSIQTAKDTQKNLELLLPLMQEISDCLSQIADVWTDITQELLETTRPALKESWTAIKEATEKYMDIITGVKIPVVKIAPNWQ